MSGNSPESSPSTSTEQPKKQAAPSAASLAIDSFCGDGSTLSRSLGPAQVIEGLVIHTDKLQEIHRRFDHARALSKIAAEPYCSLVVGESGAGKSSIIREYLRQHRPSRQPDGMIIPVLSVTTPSQATMGSVASAFLAALGDPLPDKGNIDSRTRRIRKLLKQCQTEIVILDEFQHFIDRDREKVLFTVSDWLKNLISEARLPIVLVGLEQSRRVLAANEQLRRRFQSQVEVKRFNWTADRGRYLSFLQAAERKLPFEKSSGLTNPGLAEQIYRASDGLPATIMKILRRAGHHALSQKSKSIELKHFQLAYDETVFQDKKGAGQPFFTTIAGNPPFASQANQESAGKPPPKTSQTGAAAATT
ncbi:TniB family NTP-binding protein [Ferrovibrio sp.]|uniref:TniB family NTP-binding protein n=1 Tax=Ferrovibrio sp. TaxID=1917215 RepID=UPI003D119803